uniref:Uncharacterized protein n=1 Tax=Oryza barthii TaxID=65489 RepID=A0A0D3FA84_9ORYZ
MRKVAVAMFFVVMAMSASWSPATARPYAEQPSAGGSANTALPPPTHWRLQATAVGAKAMAPTVPLYQRS